MGIADLFNSTDEKAIKFLNDNEELIKGYINEYHNSKEFDKGVPYEAKDLLLCVKGCLLKDYLYQVESKDKEAKYFFKGGFFKDNVIKATKCVYDFFEKIDIGARIERTVPESQRRGRHKMQLEQAKAAQESINKIYEYADRFSAPNQRTNKKKS